ncbi:putative membrane protein [Melghirimyces profundicolus]|uniref:Putative membrane protein n=1 Tax=Melghirimyces profundicolus TaxID=1242148 RepID=A0A2T6C9A6_9BACL|nr:small multi-drug export protein [Melghirimyces profundicolus]PTX64918.1 putative membrane protein [Melghirimyces profundicolus]
MLEWLALFPKQLQVLFLAGLPFIELRGAIPFATLIGLPYYQGLFFGIIGNLLPIVPLLYFFEPLMERLYRFSPRYRRFFERIQKRAVEKGGPIRKYGAAVGLFLFVAVPVPGTGAYSACFAAAFFGVPFWISAGSIAVGTVCSGLLFATLSHYVLVFFGW